MAFSFTFPVWPRWIKASVQMAFFRPLLRAKVFFSSLSPKVNSWCAHGTHFLCSHHLCMDPSSFNANT